jgi:transposase-like protein
MQTAALFRIKVADDYLSGKKTILQLATEHSMSIYTVRDWVKARRDSFVIDHKRRPLGTRRDRSHEPSIVTGVFGAGGSMTDDCVRRATLDLEYAIVALQKKRNMPTFSYRKDIEV